MYSHLTRAVALERIVDRLEFAAADRRSAELLRPAVDLFEPGPATLPAAHFARVRLSWHVGRRRESGCAEA